METIGFSRNHHQQQQQQHDGDDDDDQFKNHDLMVGSDLYSWQQEQNRLLVDDSSFRCVFPCEGNERPSQGLSLSLSSTKPSGIGLQSFELRHNGSQQLRFLNSMQDDFAGKSNLHQGQFLIRNSKYLTAVQELLNEFCSLETKGITDLQKTHKKKNWDDEISSTNSSSRNQSPLCSLEFMELKKRKTKLLSMLEEVERRYKHYCDQIKAVVSSFEAVGGSGTANVYLCLASKAMSRHFRCLKDGIIGQIYATKRAMGEKDPAAPGTTRGETPRLKVLDQTLRQQRAIQQIHMMESHPLRPQRGLPERSVSVLRAWLFEHFLHP